MEKNNDIRLKRVINFEFITFTLVAIVVTMTLSTMIFYEVYKSEIIRDLQNYARVLKSTGEFDSDDISQYKDTNNKDIRLTLINEDGSVLYDSCADETTMQNHLNRPEIAKAFDSGEGQEIRRSETLNKSTYYYCSLIILFILKLCR